MVNGRFISFIILTLLVQFSPTVSLAQTDGDRDGWCDGDYTRCSGHRTARDCNDASDVIHPGRGVPNPEGWNGWCDGIDNNCDGVIDDGCDYASVDYDGDGWCAGDHTKCSRNRTAPDCNDANDVIHPGRGVPNPEGRNGWCDGIDNNCDGVIDDGCDYASVDYDGDGWCAGDHTKCSRNRTAPDCNDANDVIHPGRGVPNPEGRNGWCDGIDNNCDGVTDEGCQCVDNDGDQWGIANLKFCWSNVADCNDSAKSINPGNGTCTETCVDADSDGYSAVNPSRCPHQTWDCNDSNRNINPGRTEAAGSGGESCDGLDNDCDGVIDEGCNRCVDRDGDGYGVGNNLSACRNTTQRDCNDANGQIHPGNTEPVGSTNMCCDGIDNNCDGVIDEGCNRCVDRDGDGYGVGNNLSACRNTTQRDCNDTNGQIHPGKTEPVGSTNMCCDGIDNNCDGVIDEGCNRCVDRDGDGFGVGNNLSACRNTTQRDCNDANGSVNAGNGNCPSACLDLDGDGYDNCSSLYDCDDRVASINRSGSEICDGLDNDCNGQIDEAPNCVAARCMDLDGDGWGTGSDAALANCPHASASDCDDLVGAINPGVADDICDARDNDCDGRIDENPECAAARCHDLDGDGYGTGIFTAFCLRPGEQDCDDLVAAINPGVTDNACDGRDNNCDGRVDEGCRC